MTHRDQKYIKIQCVTLAWYCLRQHIINQLLIKIVPEKINETFSTNYFLRKSLIRFLHFQELLVNIKFLDYEGNHITYSRHLLSWKFKGNTFVTLHIICFYSMKEHTTLELVVQSTNCFYNQMTVTLSEKNFPFLNLILLFFWSTWWHFIDTIYGIFE